MSKYFIIILATITVLIATGCTPKFHQLPNDITERSWSVTIAKKEYYAGKITKSQYKSIIYHIKREYNFIASELKNEYRIGAISKTEYRKRAREAKYAYNVQGMHSIQKANQSSHFGNDVQLKSDNVQKADIMHPSVEVGESEQGFYAALPKQAKEMIKKKCANDFPDDYSQQAECAETQAKSWFELNN
ncbi:MAG: hypothetical protein JXI43_02230 [Tissierellales bacterium]|nr:hypothetical protein [Tissierellales bacterium]